MAVKKYLSLDRLTEYDALIKQEIANSVSDKANTSHTHDDRYYTETEIDTKLADVNTSIGNITNGTTVVKEANHATSADSATSAESASVAENATTLGSITDDTGSTTNPIYLKKGVATAGSTYAGGTKVTLNGSAKGGSTASFYAPTAAGTAGQILVSAGTGAPTWTTTIPVANGGTGAATAEAARTNLDVYSKSEVDSALSGVAGSDHNHDDDYDEKGAAAAALASAQSYADSAATTAANTVKNDLLNGAGTAYDTLKELGDLIDDNADAIDALETIASGKADAVHSHDIDDVTGLQDALDGKANSSHGTHVTFDSTNKPKMDGTAAFGTSTKVARADHVHPTDTSRASQADLDALETVVNGKADATHTHNIEDITDLTVSADELNYMEGVTSNVQEQLDGKSDDGHTHSDATTSAAGFMTADMVTKLNGIATGANKTTVDSALSSSSTNPVQNKVVNSAISELTSIVSANTSSISSHTTAIGNLQTAIGEIQEISSAEIQALFA